MTENWLAGVAHYESWIGDSENEGSPDLDRVFADAHDFQMARAAEQAHARQTQQTATPIGGRTVRWEVPSSEAGAPTVPEPNENALTASLASLAVPTSRHAAMRCPVQQARACMRRDLGQDGTVDDTRPPSPTGSAICMEIEVHPKQPEDANDWDDTKLTQSEPEAKVLAGKLTKPWLTAAGRINWHPDPKAVALRYGLGCSTREPLDIYDTTSACSDPLNGLPMPALHTRHNNDLLHAEAPQVPEDATDAFEQGQAEENERELAAVNPLTRRQWPFPQIAARQNEGDPIEEWDSDSGGATLGEDPPMPKTARRNMAWVGAQAPLESPTRGRGAQEASSTTSTRPAQWRSLANNPTTG